jgi:hypothetical protein
MRASVIDSEPSDPLHRTGASMPDIPPNIKEFNEITAVIFAELYRSHPKPATIETTRIAQILGHSPTDILPSGRSFQDMEVHTLHWLDAEGFISHMSGSMTASRCTLTARSLGGFKDVGSELAQVAEKGSSAEGKKQIAELMGEFFGSFTGSVIKSMSGPG